MTPPEFGALAARHKQGQERTDWRYGMVAATIANSQRDPKQRPQAYKPQDFMPSSGERPRQSWEQQLSIVRLFNEALHEKAKAEGAPE